MMAIRNKLVWELTCLDAGLPRSGLRVKPILELRVRFGPLDSTYSDPILAAALIRQHAHDIDHKKAMQRGVAA